MTRIMPVRSNGRTLAVSSRPTIRMAVAPGAGAANASADEAEASAVESAASAAAALISEDAAAVSAAAALVSETNAETAETNAETAQAAAEAARDAALIAETAAELAETNAETAASTATTQAGIATTQAGLAATAATNAQTAETNAETAEAAAEAAQAAAEAAAASVDLPIIAPGDAGKSLIVNITEDSYELAVPAAGYTNEEAQDAVGGILSDAGDIDFTYDDGTPAISAVVKSGAITYAKMQDVSATDRILGRDTALAGDIEELTLTQVLDMVGSAAQGDILYRGASAWSRLAKGTAGQSLRQNSALTAPEWKPYMAFTVHKNGTNQTGILSATDTKVTWATETFDVGGYFDLANSRVTPPAGLILFTGVLQYSAGVVDQNFYQARLYKNGALYRAMSVVSSSTAAHSAAFTLIEEASGTDYYEIYAFGGGAGDKTVAGIEAGTYWSGYAL